MVITISTILSLTSTYNSPIICNMPTTISLHPSRATYVPYRTLEDAVLLPNTPKSWCICMDRMGVTFVSLNLSDNASCSPASRRSLPLYLRYMLLWHISTVLTLPPIYFCRALQMLHHVFLIIYISMRLFTSFGFLILPLVTYYFTLRVNKLAL